MVSEKFTQLKETIRGYGKVAVAFSGGVDSTVLLHNCCEALESNKVLACHVASCLISDEMSNMCEKVFRTHFASRCNHRLFEVDPLGWEEFSRNDRNRCYFCKKQIYRTILNGIAGENAFLVDGTNLDDAGEDRPGAKAVAELHVKTPLLDCGISKTEVREYARENGLINHDLPSNSCLATRIAVNRQITQRELDRVEKAEEFLNQLGFSGCRVRLSEQMTILELSESDMTRIGDAGVRGVITTYFRGVGSSQLLLNLKGRS